jgi:hypothetical protein
MLVRSAAGVSAGSWAASGRASGVCVEHRRRRVAAAHSVDPVRWQTAFGAVIDRIAPRFARYEPVRRAGGLVLGLLSGLDRKNCWTIAEQRGEVSPDGLQHLLARATWDADAVRDDLRGYVCDAFAEPGRGAGHRRD